MIKIFVPELGEGIEKVQISCWHKKVGDKVEKDDDLVELIADKAAFNVPIPENGVLREICVNEGEEAIIGQVLASIE